MNAIAKMILATNTVKDADGKEYPLHSNTPVAQCEFLQRLIQQIDARYCLEIGLAYGLSSLFICEVIAPKAGCKFISIDPFQEHWQDIGILNLRNSGYDGFVEFYREYSHLVLPKLLLQGDRLDFAYVDTSKVFDAVLLDAYYLTRLLKIGGLLVFDDCYHWAGVKRMARYLAAWPHLKIIARHSVYHDSFKKKVLSRVANVFPKKEHLFSHQLLVPDEQLGVNADCLAFQKIAEDERRWDWYELF